jgi:formyltetrahydrofolate-dependent phosphoribosylglycinamide formyltransferase
MKNYDLHDLDDLRHWREDQKKNGRRVVLTNGCFDLLHAGHVRYLDEARALGDALVIALNDDASVRALKGPQRPINTQEDRAEVMAALRSVDRVVLFSGERCTAVINALTPDLYAKGGDYTPDSLNPEEKAALVAAGTTIKILPLVPGRSTTNTLQKMSAGQKRLLRLGVLGSGAGTNFAAILRAIQNGALEADVTCVISDKENSGILEQARAANLTHAYVAPGDHPNRLADSAQKEICDRLRGAQVDLVVLAGFMRRLKEPVLSAFPQRIINVHPSLLPAFAGKEAWVQALSAGVVETGITVHLVDAGLDTGPILAQEKIPIDQDETAESLRLKLNAAEQVLYPRIIGEYGARILSSMHSAT